jgi:hypothetical protein
MPKPETPERNVLFKAEENSLSVAVLQYALCFQGKCMNRGEASYVIAEK